MRALLAAMPDRYRVAGMLAAGAGLRQGEALGLTVDRMDFLRRQLRIDRQMVTPATGEPYLGPPKSEASGRTVPLANVLPGRTVSQVVPKLLRDQGRASALIVASAGSISLGVVLRLVS